MAEASTKKSTRTLPRWLTDRDWGLLILLIVLNLRSAYTTVLGARQLLPFPLADVMGLTVQGMLFLVLGGFALTAAPVRKWVMVMVFAAACVYASFFAVYDELAGKADEKEQLDTALQAHAAVVSGVYQPARSRIDTLAREAEALFELAEREAGGGATTGVSGYGPIAKKYAADAGAKKVEAEGLQADLDRLQPHFEFELDGLSPDDIYRKDLEAWQLAPSDWKASVPMPLRKDYVDLDAQVALLTPVQRVKEGDMNAIVALVLAAMVDGIAIFLGTAIDARQRHMGWSEQVARMIAQAKTSTAVVREAIKRPAMNDPKREEQLLDDALQVVDLRIAGRGSDFLTTFYQAIHPETGALDFQGLQRHPNPTYRIAARMLVDQLRNPQLRWVTVEDGWWSVPDDVYSNVTAWLGEHIRRECEMEAQGGDVGEVHEPERTLRLVIPAS
jgi:hypothetical protein